MYFNEGPASSFLKMFYDASKKSLIFMVSANIIIEFISISFYSSITIYINYAFMFYARSHFKHTRKKIWIWIVVKLYVLIGVA